MKDPQEVVFWISDACKRYYGDRLHAVLHIGSSSSAISGHTDIDLIIVLNDRETFKDMVTLRNILNEYDFIFDVQILNLEYIDQRIFSHFSHGQFFALFLSRATVLFGSNPFGGLRVSRADVIVSVIQKMQYYYFRAKGCVLENKYRGILKKNEFRYHRKKILFMLIDYYLAEEDKISMLRNKRDLIEILKSLNLEHLKDDSFLHREYLPVNFEKVFFYYQILFDSIVTRLRERLKEIDNSPNSS